MCSRLVKPENRYKDFPPLRLTVISYEEFLEDIRQLNEISSRYLDDNGKQLVFAVKKGTDSTILWRATVRIACVKLDAQTRKIESCRALSLKQFLVVYSKLRHQVLNGT